MIEQGQTAPEVTLPDQDGNPVSLADFKNQTVVLYFYPKVETPGSIHSHDDHSATAGNRHHPRLASQRTRRRVVRLSH